MTRLNTVAVTHRGTVRETNEDSIGVAGLVSSNPSAEPVQLLINTDRLLPFIVADGLGGHAQGHRASQLATHLISDAWMNDAVLQSNWMRDDWPDEDREVALAQALHDANTALYAEASLDPGWTGMGTTFVGLLIGQGRSACVNVGDSPCFLFTAQDQALVTLSTADSPEPPIGEQPSGPSTIVTQTLGGHREPTRVEPHVQIGRVAQGDRLLICSDGLTNFVATDDVERSLKEHPEPLAAVKHLLATAFEAGAPDNVSIVLVVVLD